jgi:hypothetical protein
VCAQVLKIRAQTNPAALSGKGFFGLIAAEGMGLYRGAGWTAARNAPGEARARSEREGARGRERDRGRERRACRCAVAVQCARAALSCSLSPRASPRAAARSAPVALRWVCARVCVRACACVGSFALFGGSAFVKDYVYGLDDYNR